MDERSPCAPRGEPQSAKPWQVVTSVQQRSSVSFRVHLGQEKKNNRLYLASTLSSGMAGPMDQLYKLHAEGNYAEMTAFLDSVSLDVSFFVRQPLVPLCSFCATSHLAPMPFLLTRVTAFALPRAVGRRSSKQLASLPPPPRTPRDKQPVRTAPRIRASDCTPSHLADAGVLDPQRQRTLPVQTHSRRSEAGASLLPLSTPAGSRHTTT